MPGAKPKDGRSFTARDFELLAKVLTCMKTELNVDYKKFAEVAGFGNANSAKAAWHSLKKKIDHISSGGTTGPSLALDGVDDDDVASTNGKKRKAKNTDDAPAAKKGRKPRSDGGVGKAAAMPTTDIDDHEDKPEVYIKAE